MKIVRAHTILILFLFSFNYSTGQGKVVINEFMPWAGCNTASEFIELMNFGPGPMDIGCYIITNGTYSVTIPPNTVLQRGQYFILSGQNILPQNCGNTDSAVHVDLNWTTCNCTNVTIPTTGDGFLQNGGNANDKVVLLDPNLNVVDAVSTNIPASSSVSITTPSVGGCGSKTFNLNMMSVNYESTGPSTGNNNSIARKIDGDCGWVKTTAISAHAPNKTGSSASATYDFTAVSTLQCNNVTGSISIQVSSGDVNSLFPMNYTLAFDADGDGIFSNNDQYIYGIDNTAPSIDIDNLAYGRYRIAVGSSSSCNLKSYDFYVFNCYTVVLPVKLMRFSFVGTQNGTHEFRFKVDNASALSNVVLEGSNGNAFTPVANLYAPFRQNELSINSNGLYQVYRLKLVNHAGIVSYSEEIKIDEQNNIHVSWPNPVQDKIYVNPGTASATKFSYTVFNSNGMVVKKGQVDRAANQPFISISTEHLTNGIYYLKISASSLTQSITVRFIK